MKFLILLASAAAIAAQGSPCDTIDCASGLVCRMQVMTNCLVSPCPRMPVCVPQNSTCDQHKCKDDETCVLKQVTCITAPCYPVPECVKYPKCETNEEYNECSLTGPCEPTCTDAYPICNDVRCGKGACECKAGFVRHNGTCIAKTECPDPTCENINEIWNKCPSNCPEKTCRIFRGKDKEEMFCNKACGIAMCTCAPGYVRDDDYKCVKQDDCPKEFLCDSPNEQFVNCSTMCEPTCADRHPACVEMCGPPKCQCKVGYGRDNGNCIYLPQCPQNGTGGPRPILTCASFDCIPGMFCKMVDGRPRCVTVSSPAPTNGECPANEVLRTCTSVCSETNCGEDPNALRACPMICGPTLCKCKDGFQRHPNGQCVATADCGAPVTPKECPVNEILKECTNSCSEFECGEDPKAIRPCTMMCGPTLCKCKDGFQRHPNGQCVASNDCPVGPVKDCPANEVLKECTNSCSETMCGQDPNPLMCTAICGPTSCKCAAGYQRHSSGKCVAIADCGSDSTNSTCPENETLNNCSNSCAEAKCQKTLNKMECPQVCGPPRCECSKGYAREVNGTCVKETACPSYDPTKCGLNEVYKECSSKCQEAFCGDETAGVKLCPASCGAPACECDRGFVRDGEKGCVKREDCTPIMIVDPPPHNITECSKNETFTECSNPCSEFKCGQDQSENRVCAAVCGPAKCQCSKGFVRDPVTAKCVLANDCSPSSSNSTCPENETWKECSNKCAEPKCKKSMNKMACAQVCGEPACECSKGYARAENGTCITQTACPSYEPQGECPKNETFTECSNPCSESQCGQKEPAGHRICPAVCGPSNCQCSSGFVRDPVTTHCVLPTDCSGKGANNNDVCANHTCAEGEMCEIVLVNCLIGNCPNMAQCVPKPTCASTSCLAGTECRETEKGARCYSRLMIEDEICSNHTCPKGEVCYGKDVQCITTPCDPIPDCKPLTKCETMDCRSGSTCIDTPKGGICQTQEELNPCMLHRCSPGTHCVVEEEQCLVAPCKRNAVCRALVEINPCANHACAEGEMCEIVLVNCLIGNCPNMAQCVSKPTCASTSCLAGTECRETEKGAKCYSRLMLEDEICSNHTCPKGEVCYGKDVQCITTPCDPIPDCKPLIKCETMDCRSGSTCIDTPKGGICQTPEELNPCMLHKCSAGTNCVVEEEQCLVAPCKRNAVCRTVVDFDPCVAMLCAMNTRCELKEVKCLVPPCEKKAQCVPLSQCLHIKCSAGHECRDGPNGEGCYPIVKDVCAGHNCPEGEICYPKEVQCITAPCDPVPDCKPLMTCALLDCRSGSKCVNTPTGAVCQTPEELNPCMVMKCQAGTQCTVVEQQCLVPPCKKTAVCKADVCADHRCPKGEVCRPMNVQCIKAPCPPIPNCEPLTTCALLDCRSGSTCIDTPTGAVCRTPEQLNPCMLAKCGAGNECVVEEVQCFVPPCDKVAKCVPVATSKCLHIKCRTYEECRDGPNGEGCYPLEYNESVEKNNSSPITCANIRCSGQCVDGADGPKCVSDGSGIRQLDENGCGKGEEFTECLPKCQATCRGIHVCDAEIIEPATNATCMPGCVCRNKHKRNVQGHCVMNSRCWITAGCKANEAWHKCHPCENTCDQTNNAKTCNRKCEPGCACEDGFVRSPAGICILQKDCKVASLLHGSNSTLS